MGGVLGVGWGEGEAIVEEVGAVDGAESVGAVFGVGAAAVFAVVAVGDVVGEAAFAENFGEFGVPGGVLVGGVAVGLGEVEEGGGGWGGEDVGDGGGGEAFGVALGGDGVDLGGAGVEPGQTRLGGGDRAGEGGLAEVVDRDEVGFEDDGGAIALGDLDPGAVVIEEAAVAGGVGLQGGGGDLAEDLGGESVAGEAGFELGGVFFVGDDQDVGDGGGEGVGGVNFHGGQWFWGRARMVEWIDRGC